LQGNPLTAGDGMAAEKSLLDNEKVRAATARDVGATAKDAVDTASKAAENKYKAAAYHAQGLAYVQTPQDVMSYIDSGIRMGVFPADGREEAIKKARSYQTIEEWKKAAKEASVPVVDSYKTAADAARAKLQAETSLTTNRLTNETSARNNAAADAAAGRAITVRGQDLTDERTREGQAASLSRPFEVTGPDGSPVLVQQDRSGKLQPVDGYGAKSVGGNKPLPSPVVKQLTEARDNATTLNNLSASFAPEFAGKGVLGYGADAQLAVSGNVGADKKSVEWWKNYRKQAELIERHALFGAALTPTEQGSWRSADIGPGMNADVIASNLATRKALANKVFENTRADIIDAGHSESRVNKIASRVEGGDAGAKPSPAAPSKPASGAPKNVNFGDLK
jgi:hypothetical protein